MPDDTPKPLLPLWRPTNRWRPGRTGTASGGAGVESVDTGEVGFCKRTNVAQEKICADLAREVGARVPEVRLGRAEGHPATVAVSLAHGSESLDLPMLQSRDLALYGSEKVQNAICAASGLLPFQAWVGNTDVKDDHLVIADEGGGRFVVAGIDFSYTLQWGGDPGPVQAPGPPALVAKVDKQLVLATVEQIEACSDERIAGIVNRIPEDVLSVPDRTRIIMGLRARRARVREAMRAKGWLP